MKRICKIWQNRCIDFILHDDISFDDSRFTNGELTYLMLILGSIVKSYYLELGRIYIYSELIISNMCYFSIATTKSALKIRIDPKQRQVMFDKLTGELTQLEEILSFDELRGDLRAFQTEYFDNITKSKNT